MRLAPFLIVVVAASCADDAVELDAAPDAAPVDAPRDSGPVISAITAPALPTATCPEGWRRVAADEIAEGLEVCEPWAEDDARCAPHEMRLPADPACRTIGAPCPADGWPADLPATGVVYVRAGATAPPDGGRDAPHPDIASALAALPADATTLALAVGEYTDRFVLDSSLTIRGACAELTRLTGPIAPLRVEDAGDVTVRDITLSTSSPLSTMLVLGTSLTLRGVAFDRVKLTFQGPTLEVEDAAFRGGAGRGEYAIGVGGRSSDVTLSRILVEDADLGGVVIVGDGTHTLTDIVVRGVARQGMLLDGTSLSLTRIVIDGTADSGIVSLVGGTMTDVLVRDVAPSDFESGGIILGGSWVLDGVRIERTGSAGLLLANGTVELRDAVVVGSLPADGSRGRGIEISPGGILNAERVVIASTRDIGVFASGSASADLVDLTLHEVGANLEGGYGRCLHGQLGARIDVERALLERCTEAAVTTSLLSTATLRDVSIIDVRSLPCPDPETECVATAGIGLVSLPGGGIDAERFIISGAALAAVMIIEEADTDLRDGTIRGSPVGINVQDAAFDLGRVMERMSFADNGMNLDSSALPIPSGMAMPAGR